MKKIILPAFILLLSSFILTACLKTDVQSTATPTDYIKLSSSDDNKQGNVIKTDYYSIKIPELWKYYGYEIMNNTLSVHESYSYDEIQGGHLFSISLFPNQKISVIYQHMTFWERLILQKGFLMLLLYTLQMYNSPMILPDYT